MNKNPMIATVLAATLLTAGASPALAQERWDWGGGRADDRDYGLVGAGVPIAAVRS
jgi:hypothetical protein